MAKKPSSPPASSSKTVTLERAARLHQFLTLLGDRPQPREMLQRRLGLDIRGFYRDLDLLRSVGLAIELRRGRYALDSDPKAALDDLPFPDPKLTLGEAVKLAKGRSAVHRKLRQQIDAILGTPRRSRAKRK